MASEDEVRVQELTDRLLNEHDPKMADPKVFWGAQFDLGLAWVNFPEGLGGLGLDPRLQRIVDEGLHEHGAPSNLLRNFMGVGMAAPTIVAFGTPEQQERYLRPLFSCEEIWCQMFSEPGAGSDLAALSTRAVRDGDEWLINGQKVWTTQAHVARWGLLLARSDPNVPKHKGLTYFIADMKAPGVKVVPLRQLTGEAEFNEVYFDDVRIPDSQRIGEVAEGWKVAITTLMNERTALGAFAKEPRGAGLIRHALRVWRSRQHHDPPLRDSMIKLWMNAEVNRLTTMRAQTLRDRGTPGPEGSILKLTVSDFNQRVFDFCVDLLGPEGMLISGYEMVIPELMSESTLGDDADVVKAFLETRGSTIGGGTTEIARNIIGERVLGLPPEPRVDRDLPWSQVPRS